MNERDGFLAAILSDPADDTARSAYADWLCERADPFDRAHGRFIAAGLTLHHTREPELNNEGPFYQALAAQNDTAFAVLAAQLRALLDWDPHSWNWENATEAPGRIAATLVGGPVAGESARQRRDRRRHPPQRPTVVWERGCVSGLCLPITDVISRGPAALSRCPVERFDVIDQPGLSFTVRPGAAWSLRAEYLLPAAAAAAFPHSVSGAGGLVRFTPPAPVVCALDYSDRTALLAGFDSAIQYLLAAVLFGAPSP